MTEAADESASAALRPAGPPARRFWPALSAGWLKPERCVQLQGDRVTAWPDDGAPAQPWADWCAAHPGVRCRVLLGSQWQQVLTLDLPGLALPAGQPRRVHGRAVLRDAAKQRLVHFHGAAAADWPLALWRSTRAAGACALAVAAPATASRLLTVPAQHGLRLQQVQPAWWWALRQALDSDATLRKAPEALLLLDEDEVTTAVALRQGHIVGLLVQRQPAAAAAADAQPLAQQQVAGGLAVLGLGADARVLRLPLWPLAQAAWRLPAWRWAGAPDFRPVLPLSRLAWAGLGVACLTLALAAANGLQAWQAVDAARDSGLELAQPQRPSVTQPLLPEPRSAGGRVSPALDVDSAIDAAEQPMRAALALPWGDWLAAAEAATAPGVVWLKLDLSGTQLRLAGQAPDLDIALLAAARLGRQPGLRQVLLTRLQQPVLDAPAGGSPARRASTDPGAGLAPGSAGHSAASAATAPQFELQAQRGAP
jgi:hypothetical protein